MVINQKSFIPFFSPEQIAARVQQMADEINADYGNTEVFILAILNGSFVFAADIVRHLKMPCRISFIKLASYQGTASTGNVVEVLGLQEDITDKYVLILEDIVDTGHTMYALLEQLKSRQPASIKVATFLAKPASIQKPVTLDYTGYHIGPEFVVGFGLDFDGYGRELPGLWVAS